MVVRSYNFGEMYKALLNWSLAKIYSFKTKSESKKKQTEKSEEFQCSLDA